MNLYKVVASVFSDVEMDSGFPDREALEKEGLVRNELVLKDKLLSGDGEPFTEQFKFEVSGKGNGTTLLMTYPLDAVIGKIDLVYDKKQTMRCRIAVRVTDGNWEVCLSYTGEKEGGFFDTRSCAKGYVEITGTRLPTPKSILERLPNEIIGSEIGGFLGIVGSKRQLQVNRFLVSVIKEYQPILHRVESQRIKICQELMGGNFVGQEEWDEVYPGMDIGEVPPLPEYITEGLLNSESVMQGEKWGYGAQTRIKDTHVLTLIPESLDEVPLTINSFHNELKEAQSTENKDRLLWELDWHAGDPVCNERKRSHWMLLSKSVLPNTLNKTYEDQLKELKQEAYSNYEVPGVREVIVSVLMHYMLTGDKLLGGDHKVTYNRNKWHPYVMYKDKRASGSQVRVGSFASNGLYVSDWVVTHVRLGLGVCRQWAMGAPRGAM